MDINVQWVLCASALLTVARPWSHHSGLLSFGRGQLEHILTVQAKQVEDICQAFAVQTSWCFELDPRLGAPCDTETGGVQHEEVIGTIANGDSLRKRNLVLGRNGFEEGAFLRGIDDWVSGDEVAGQELGGRVDFKLKDLSERGMVVDTAVGCTYMVGDSIVNAELLGEPLGKRLEATAENGHLVTQSFQCAAELFRTLGDGENGLELVKDVRRNTLEKRDTLLERCGKVQFAVHRALSNFLPTVSFYAS